MNYETIKINFEKYVNSTPEHLSFITNKGLQNACKGALSKACRGDDNRKLVTKMLIGKTSSADFTVNEWYALFRFVFPIVAGEFEVKNPVTGKWSGCEELPYWCGLILEAQARQEGQTEMFEVTE